MFDFKRAWLVPLLSGFSRFTEKLAVINLYSMLVKLNFFLS